MERRCRASDPHDRKLQVVREEDWLKHRREFRAHEQSNHRKYQNSVECGERHAVECGDMSPDGPKRPERKTAAKDGQWKSTRIQRHPAQGHALGTAYFCATTNTF